MRTAAKGSITAWITHEHGDWTINDQRYDFPDVSESGVFLQVTKHVDQTFEVVINGLLDRSLEYTGLVPPRKPEGVSVGVDWTPSEVTLYLAGEPVEVYH